MMRKVYGLFGALTMCWAIAAAALEPPRVIELTDGSIRFHAVEWSPDGKRLAALSQDGVWIIEAREGALPQRINNLRPNMIKWLLDSLLVGAREERVPGHRFKRISKLFLFNDRGHFVSSDDGFVGGWPLETASGMIAFDSSGTWVGFRAGTRLTAIDKHSEAILLHRRPSRPNQADSNTTVGIWLQGLDGEVLGPIVTGRDFGLAKFSGDGSRILALHGADALSIFALDGKLTAEIQVPQDREGEGFLAWILDPELSPDNNLLLFKRGYDDIQADIQQGRELGVDVCLRDLRTDQEVILKLPAPIDSEFMFNGDGRLAACNAGEKVILMVFRD